MRRDPEAAVKACYATWSDVYYQEYYGETAPYPPVHRDLIKRLLADAGARRILDAGCGPASLLRELADDGLDVYGFDLTPEMVAEARRVLAGRGLPSGRIWEGRVTDRSAFQPPGGRRRVRFDAALCVGVLPHLPPEADVTVIQNLRSAVPPGGLVVLEARNQLFGLFTLNRYAHRLFLDELVQPDRLAAQAGQEAASLATALDQLASHFRTDLPPVRLGKAGEPGYDQVVSRTHNPLVLREQFTAAGFRDVRVLFYHYHCLPPMLGAQVPELFRRASLAMEDPSDWRGHVMASAFLLAGRRA